MDRLYPVFAFSLGFWISLGSAVLLNGSWFALGVLSMACGIRDLLPMAGIKPSRAVSYVFDCLLLATVFLVLSLFKPVGSDAPHELD
jgi:hypothetical protein